jgi:enoyl-CoA hydratase
MSTIDVLKTDRDGAVLILTLNRPASRNALNLDLARAIESAVANYESDDSLRAMVLTGADPAFCGGLDLKEFSGPASPRGEVGKVLRAFPNRKKPAIGAINGAAMTGGLELALGCDFLVASEQARFGDTHVKVGTLSGGGMTSRLPWQIGPRWAKQMSLTCQPIDAATALRIGLVNEVVAHAALLTRALELAQMIAGFDPWLVEHTRQVIDQGGETSLADNMRLEAEAIAAMRARGSNKWNAVLK